MPPRRRSAGTDTSREQLGHVAGMFDQSVAAPEIAGRGSHALLREDMARLENGSLPRPCGKLPLRALGPAGLAGQGINRSSRGRTGRPGYGRAAGGESRHCKCGRIPLSALHAGLTRDFSVVGASDIYMYSMIGM